MTLWWVGRETIRYTEVLEMITYMEISFKFNGHRIQLRQAQWSWIQFQAPMMVTTCCMEAAETISFTAEEVLPISYKAGGTAMTPCSAPERSEMCLLATVAMTISNQVELALLQWKEAQATMYLT